MLPEGTAFREYGCPGNKEVRLTGLPESLKPPMDATADEGVRDNQQGSFSPKKNTGSPLLVSVIQPFRKKPPRCRGRGQDAAVCSTSAIGTLSLSTPDTGAYVHGIIIEHIPTRGTAGKGGGSVPHGDEPGALVS